MAPPPPALTSRGSTSCRFPLKQERPQPRKGCGISFTVHSTNTVGKTHSTGTPCMRDGGWREEGGLSLVWPSPGDKQ